MLFVVMILDFFFVLNNLTLELINHCVHSMIEVGIMGLGEKILPLQVNRDFGALT